MSEKPPASLAIARSIARLLDDHEISQSAVARGMGRGQSAVSSWTINGTQDLDILADLEDFLGEAPGAILRGAVRDDGRPYVSPGASVSVEDAIRRDQRVDDPMLVKLALEQWQTILNMARRARKPQRGRKAS